MKIICQSCQSKYNVADEKVQGKIVKIRCRKCSATIVVNGTAAGASNGAVGTAESASPAAPKSEPADASTWHVNVAEDDQRTVTLGELGDLLRAGTVTRETYVWRDGMADWLPVGEIDAITSWLDEPASVRDPGTPAPAPTRAREDVDEPTRAFQAPSLAAYSAPAAPGSGPSVDAVIPKIDVSPRVEVTPKADVAPRIDVTVSSDGDMPDSRRATLKREPRNRDLFAPVNATPSPGKGDALSSLQTSAPLLDGMTGPGIDDGAHKRTGERNENSVLFSLAVLTKTAEERAPSSSDEPPSSTKEDSGLIDLKALAAKTESMRPMIMADSAVFSPPLGGMTALAAPFGATAADDMGPPKSRLPLLIGGGAGALLILVLGIVIGVKVLGSTPAVPAGTASAAALPPPAPASESPSAPTAAPEPSEAPAASAAAAQAQGSAVAPKAKSPPTGAWHPQAAAKAAAPAAAPAPAPAPAPAAAPSKKNDCGCNGDLMCLMKCSTH